ncbi:MAG: type II toxin-antitoxin system RelE/ParE family toxin [Nitrospirae bacterium]|nr:type II toxin-antitoxin system RelE/ParE family toxin [Nitrospirota bacterium]
MNITILEIARLEFNEAKEFYEIEQTGLGAKFENEIKNGLLHIQKFPQAWPSERKETRRYLVRKFSYKIIYSVQEDNIIILAFAHLHRKPNYWVDRIK